MIHNAVFSDLVKLTAVVALAACQMSWITCHYGSDMIMYVHAGA